MTRLHLLAALSLGATACTTESDSAMVIVHNQLVEDDCLVSGDPGGDARPFGVLHPESPSGYVFTPVVQSVIAESASSERTIVLEGARISVTTDDGGSVSGGAFTTRFSTSLGPGDSTGLIFEITPPGLGAGRYTSTVTVFGTLDGGDAESEPFAYPVEVVEDQLVLGPCGGLEPGYQGQLVGSACNIFQDGGIECCTDGTELVCPAVGPPLPPA